MTRLTITLDEELLDETQRALGAQTRAETVRISLTETLRRQRLAEALAHQGQVELDLEPATLQALREQG